MTQFNHRIDIKESNFPLLSSELGETVLVSSFSGQPTGEKPNQPQLYYAHNMMPLLNGIVSVGFAPEFSLASGQVPNDTFNDASIIFSSAGERVHFCRTKDDRYYVKDRFDVNGWRALTALPPTSANIPLSFGTVNGITYIYWQTQGAWIYSEQTRELQAVELTGLDIASVVGITASYGYLIAFTKNALAWSSTISPTDFTPSLTTGAGGGLVSDIQGAIVFAAPNSLGILIYTFANVVAGTYTGNAVRPFKFRSVDNSKGADTLDSIAYENNAEGHYVFSKGGLQVVSSRQSKNLLPEVTDFLAGKVIEDFNEDTKEFIITHLSESQTLLKKVKFISSRYLVISYGITTFTHAIIYDVSLERIGKVKLDHTDVFEYIGAQTEIAKENLCFLQANGDVLSMRSSAAYDLRSGVAIFGRYQYYRDAHLVLHRVDCSQIAPTDDFTFTDLATLDGSSTYKIAEGKETALINSRSFALRQDGKNHSLVFIGKFLLTSIQLLFTTGGRR